MNYITTTELRTKSSQLIKSLEKGAEVSLIHRSKIVAVIKPKKEEKVLTKKSIIKLKKLIREMNVPPMSYEEREKVYRKHLEEKYGKGLS